MLNYYQYNTVRFSTGCPNNHSEATLNIVFDFELLKNVKEGNQITSHL